jgi:hypothetical protein
MNADPSTMPRMISEMAAPLISEGTTPEEKHHRLTAAFSALNNSCNNPFRRTGYNAFWMGGPWDRTTIGAVLDRSCTEAPMLPDVFFHLVPGEDS